MTNEPMQSLDVFFYFEQRELKIDFKHSNKAEAYQELNREGRIFSNQRTAVYLPLSQSMKYVRDSSSGLVIGFANRIDAVSWCDRSIIGYMHSDIEVHIRRRWEDSELDKRLHFSKRLSLPASAYDTSQRSNRTFLSPLDSYRQREGRVIEVTVSPPSGPRRFARRSRSSPSPPRSGRQRQARDVGSSPLSSSGLLSQARIIGTPPSPSFGPQRPAGRSDERD